MKEFPPSWASAPVRRLASAMAIGILFVPAVASANLITDGGFESTAIATNTNFVVNDPSTHGRWLDIQQWQRIVDPGDASNHIAAHITSSNNTNMLFQGFDASAFGVGTTLSIDFRYIFEAGGGRSFRIYGLQSGDGISRFAPWNNLDGSSLSPLQSWSLGLASDWTAISQTFTLTGTYAAIVIGFVFSSGADVTNHSALRAVDDVVITASVPAPAPLALFGLGLMLIGLSRKIRFGARRMI